MLVSYICGVFLLTYVWSAEATTSVKRLNIDVGTEPKCQANEDVLLCADSQENKIYQFTFESNEVLETDIPCGSPNVVLPYNNSIVVTYDRLIFLVEIGIDGKFEFFTALDLWKPDNFIAFCEDDAIGYIWCVTNTFTNGTSSLYRVKERITEVILTPFFYLRVFAFDPKFQFIYFIDSKNGIIYIGDLNLAEGSITNIRVFITIGAVQTKIVGKANYIDVDIRGNVYISVGNPGRYAILKYSPSGKFLSLINLPVGATVISITLGGGVNFATLYVGVTVEGRGVVYAVTGLVDSNKVAGPKVDGASK